MPDLVNRLRFSLACIEFVREIDDKGVAFADIAISVHDARWHVYHGRILFTSFDRYKLTWLSGTVLPKIDLVLPVDEREPVSLMDMLVWPTRYARFGHAEISHRWTKALWKFVGTEKLKKPAASICEASEGFDDDSRNGH